MLSENIKVVRKSKGLSQEELAIKLHVVRQTVSKWENGLSVPDSDMLLTIAEALETPVSTLLGSRRAESDCRKAGGYKPAACPEEKREAEADPLAADRTVRSRGRDFRSPARVEQSLSGLGLQRSGNRRRRRGFPCVRVAVCPAGAGRSHRGGRWNC